MNAYGEIEAAGACDPTIVREDLFTGCFAGGPGRLTEPSGLLRFNTGDMFPGKVFDFRVVATKYPGRASDANFTLTVIPTAAPEITNKYIQRMQLI